MTLTEVGSVAEAESVLRAIVDNVTDGIITIDQVGTIQSVNLAVVRLFGYDVDEVVGQDIRMLMPGLHSSEDAQYFHSYLTTANAKFMTTGIDVEGLCKDGTTIPLGLTVSEATSDGARMFVGIVRDLKEERAAVAEIERQHKLVLDLSTPVIELWDGLLLLPLVGQIDNARASQINEQLLQAIVDRSARVVVLDVTGVPLIDTTVAQHLIRTVAAAKMMGAAVVVTGFSPEAAQTLTNLGLDLAELDTRGSLRSGVAEGLTLLGLKVAASGGRSQPK